MLWSSMMYKQIKTTLLWPNILVIFVVVTNRHLFAGEVTSLPSNVKSTINIMKQEDGILAAEKSNESLTNESTNLKISNNGLEAFSILTGTKVLPM